MSQPYYPALIAVLAYEIWERDGRPEGLEQEHWRQAERQLSVGAHSAMPDATGDEDPDSYLSSSDSDRATAERGQPQQLGATKPAK